MSRRPLVHSLTTRRVQLSEGAAGGAEGDRQAGRGRVIARHTMVRISLSTGRTVDLRSGGIGCLN